jgi:hypothetical protein
MFAKTKILIISFSDLANDPRVNRQIRFLLDNYQITTFGFKSPNIDNVDFYRIPQEKTNIFQKSYSASRLLLGLYENYYWDKPEIQFIYEKVLDLDIDLIIVNDIDPLPVAIKLAKEKNIKVIFDAHEYAPREFEDRFLFKIFFQNYKTFLCKKYIPYVDGMITVCKTIADQYETDTKIKPSIITNAPDYEELSPKLLESQDKVKIVHHGWASPSRRTEKMIRMMDFLDNKYELNLMLLGLSTDYGKHLKKIAEGKQNVKFIDPVPMKELCNYTNRFDIGLFLLEPTNFNYRYALPNKLFEFIQARLAIAIGPSPEMARIVRDHDLGVIAEDFEPKTLAEKIMALDYQKINYYKQQSHQAAYELSAERNKQILLDLVQTTLT